MSRLFMNTNQSDPAGLLTHEQVQDRFRKGGVCIADWATQNGFSSALVYAVMKGQRKCLRGESHKIAVALGMKAL